jgi:starvation-inducible outer membrane lipoprotein
MRGVFPVSLPVCAPRPELRRHRPGRQLTASKGSVEPPIFGGEDITVRVPPRCVDGAPTAA